ncbi:MAG: hypothetical protein AXA67_11005 [Methylothermaceae bacteria B42]|nr:MAG: hypothetical protein AXA67_11005 [Methylothermaceae bacteria B42]HHJ39003.1 peptidoglycan-associated lipoprotein Pal [Methylothermaceae bacterium]
MRYSFFLVLAIFIGLSGCKSKGDLKTEALQTPAGATTQGLEGEEGVALHEVQTQGLQEDGIGPVDSSGMPVSKVIYFDFDSAQVRGEDIPVIQAHAKYLLENPQVKVVLEGHTDERGSREYNVALSEARAIAVAKIFELQGVPSTQVSVVPYGEEKPVALGHNEEAWSKNRRVEIVYQRSQ